MKHLFIFCSPTKSFPKEYDDLIKIQIDNSLVLGVKPEDIILAFNFPYEYKDVKSILIGDYSVYDQNRSTKIQVINELFKRDLIEENQTYWFHDFDAFQLVPFEIEFKEDAAFTTHGVQDPVMWNAGSFFFKKSAKDIFIWIEEWMEKLGFVNEQRALTHMWKIDYNHVNARCKMLDSSYNLIIYKIPENIAASQLPIKVAHFHPHKKHHIDRYRELLPQSLMKIFNSYGIS